MMIGITGTDGAGKGTVVDYLVEKKGFKRYHVRSLLLKEIEEKGLPNDRATMRLVANDIRREFGNDAFVVRFLKEAQEKGDTHVVIDSIRAKAEAETLRNQGGILLCVDADRKIRYERIKERASSSDHVTFEEFILLEEREMNDPDPSGMQKAEVMKMADHTILNNVSLDALYADVERFLEHYRSKI